MHRAVLDERLLYQGECLFGVIFDVGPQQRLDIFKERRIRLLVMEVLLELGSGDGVPFVVHVCGKTSNDALRGKHPPADREPQIEQIPSLLALV